MTVTETAGFLPALPKVCPASPGPAGASLLCAEHSSPEAVEAAGLVSPASPPHSHSRLVTYLRREAACGELPVHKTRGYATFPTL